MAFDTILAERIRGCLATDPNVAEKKMFGGLGFLHRGNMLVAVWKDSLIARVGLEGRGVGGVPTEEAQLDRAGTGGLCGGGFGPAECQGQDQEQ